MPAGTEHTGRKTWPTGLLKRERLYIRRLVRWVQRLAPDLLALLILGGVLLALLLSVALLPPARWTVPMADPPAPVKLRGFFALEQNAAGPYRWTEPEATLTFPLTAPADYRLTLTLQDSPLVQPPRSVTIRLNGTPARMVQLDAVLREYTVDYHVDPATLGPGGQRTLRVGLRTDPLVLPGDPRPLGVLVTRVTLNPLPASPWQPMLLAPNLLFLLVGYSTLRLLGVGLRVTAGSLGALLAAYALLALTSRIDALRLALTYASLTRTFGGLGAVLWLAGLPLIGALLWLAAVSLLAHPPSPWARARRGPTRWGWTARLGASLRAALAGGFGEALWLFATLRVAFSLFALLASLVFRLARPCSGGQVRPPLLYSTGLDFRLLGVWQNWDACWYERIAATGYLPGDSAVAFFPLYPLLMRAVSLPLAGNLTLGGLAVAGVAYIAAMAGLYRLAHHDFDEGVARRAVLYLSVFPSAFFLFAPYSEALFLALAVWTIYLARRGSWGWAAPLALLVGLTRTQGAFLALPLAWEVVRQWRAGGRRPARALVPLLPPCGMLSFIGYSKVFTGLTTFTVQRTTWGARPRTPWAAVAVSWEHVRGRGDAIEALNLALLLAFGALLLLGLRRLPPAYSLYVAPQLLLIASRQNLFSPLMSTSRLVLVLFPVFILLALAGGHRRLHYSWLLASTLLLAFLLYTFLSGTFAA